MRIAFACVLVFATGVLAADGPAFPVVRWSGVVADEKKQKAAPESDLITNQKALDALWKEWRTDEPPQVDFATHFVLVRTMKAKMGILQYSVSKEGDLTYTSLVEADKNGAIKKVDGFGYGIAVIPRVGVLTYGRKPLP